MVYESSEANHCRHSCAVMYLFKVKELMTHPTAPLTYEQAHTFVAAHLHAHVCHFIHPHAKCIFIKLTSELEALLDHIPPDDDDTSTAAEAARAVAAPLPTAHTPTVADPSNAPPPLEQWPEGPTRISDTGHFVKYRLCPFVCGHATPNAASTREEHWGTHFVRPPVVYPCPQCPYAATIRRHLTSHIAEVHAPASAPPQPIAEGPTYAQAYPHIFAFLGDPAGIAAQQAIPAIIVEPAQQMEE
jgi:hypothetical protein